MSSPTIRSEMPLLEMEVSAEMMKLKVAAEMSHRQLELVEPKLHPGAGPLTLRSRSTTWATSCSGWVVVDRGGVGQRIVRRLLLCITSARYKDTPNRSSPPDHSMYHITYKI